MGYVQMAGVCVRNVEPSICADPFIMILLFKVCSYACVGWDRVVGIATGYGLDDPGIGSRSGRDFSAPV